MPSTLYALTAASLPPLQGPGAARLIGADGVSPATVYGGKTIGFGTTEDLPDTWNKNALEVDYSQRTGAFGYGVVEGLSFSGTALTITVAPGKATLDALIELSVATTVTVANGTNYIWLKQDGTLESKLVTTAPTIPGCMIGVVIVAAGAVVNYDLSGVMYHGAGILERRTGDAFKPADTPGVTWAFLQRSVNATYLWDGSQYVDLNRSKLVVVPLAAVDSAGGVLSWQNPEAVAIAIIGFELDITTPATVACSLDAGTTITTSTTASDNLIDSLDVHTAAGLFNVGDQTGANGKTRQRLASGKWVTISKDTGATAGMVGNAYIRYYLLG